MNPKPEPAKSPEPSPTGDVMLSLVARVLEGDTRAFEEIVRLCDRHVYRVCLAITGDVQDAEESMQDTFLNAHRNLRQFRGEARFTTWLTRIAVNEALQRLRRRKKTASLDELVESEESSLPRQLKDWHPNPEELYSAREMRQILEEAIWALPVAYRVVFVLRDVCHESTRDVAEALDLSLPAAKSRLLRARLMVRQSLTRRFRKSSALRLHLQRAGAFMRALADRFCSAIGLRRRR